MIRVFGITDNVFNTNGDVVISAGKARVFNSDNGDFYLEISCGNEYNDYIQANNIIVAPTPQGAQAFRIRTVEKKSNRLEAKAWHLFYDSNNYLIADSYAVNMTAKQALNHFNAATDNPSPFTMDSNVVGVNNLRIVRGSLAEAVTQVIERWGGHLVRDNFNITVKGSIGHDNGITIEYRKNLKELTATYEWGDVVTKLMPVGKDGILLDELYIYSATQYAIPFTKTISFEQDIEREDYPSEEDYIAALKDNLREQAQNYIAVACMPIVNYTLKGNPEKVTDIGDIIEVRDSRIGVNVLTKVISYEYDAIANKYVNLEFGNFTPKLSSLMSDIKSETNIQIANATNNINVEVNALVDAITALNTLVAELETDKQDALTTGAYIEILNNVIKCTLTAGDGIVIDSNSNIKLAALDAITCKDNVITTIDTNVATLYISVPRPIDTYSIDSLSLKIYTSGDTTVDLTDQTTGITLTSDLVNDYMIKITLTDAGTTLTGLAGAYNSYVELDIAP